MWVEGVVYEACFGIGEVVIRAADWCLIYGLLLEIVMHLFGEGMTCRLELGLLYYPRRIC